MDLLDRIKTKKILVIGDIMLDCYYYGEVKRISPEAPVPVFKKKSERYVMGGAANVVANLVGINQDVSVMSIIGDDECGRLLKDMFNEKKVDTSMLLTINRDTTVKTRFLADNNQQIMRLDVEQTEPIDDVTEKLLIDKLKNKISTFDYILISDYMKGLLTFELVQKIISLANQYNKNVVIDVKDPNYEKYKGAFLLKPNLLELSQLTKMKVSTEDEIITASKKLLSEAKSKYILTTCGANGMRLVSKDSVYSLKSVGKEVFDVTGAGDTSISYLVSCLANEIDIKKSVEISNVAAGIQVGKVGTSIVTINEVKKYYNCKEKETKKIVSLNELKVIMNENKEKTFVFTNGCFDIIHSGHTKYLNEAAKLGDYLIVGLNSDDSVKRLKGKSRPINNQNDRAEVLSALSSVDYIIIFEEDTPYELISNIKPNVLVKGKDYKPENVVGRDIVEKNGGKLVLIDYVDGKSTTNIINKISEGNS